MAQATIQGGFKCPHCGRTFVGALKRIVDKPGTPAEVHYIGEVVGKKASKSDQTLFDAAAKEKAAAASGKKGK